ncbi:MAG: type II toxin-antitoxin system VapC family toxin [Pirellulales bacterium]
MTYGCRAQGVDRHVNAAYLSGDARVLEALAVADRVWMSTVVLGELYTGFKGGARTVENSSQLRTFLAKPTVRPLDVNQETAEIFGEVKFRLKQAGTPIPINDVWIGAHALETGSVLIGYDKHFSRIAGLRYWLHLQS